MSNSDSLIVVSSSGRITQLSGTSESKAVKNKSGNNSPIKHIIFSYFSNIARNNGDKYWEDLFLCCAKNSFPRDFRFDGKNLQFKLKSKAIFCNVYPIPDISLEEKYAMVKQFISSNSGLISKQDANLLQDSVRVIPGGSDPIGKNKIVKEITWSSFTSVRVQIMFLQVFCELKAKEFNFNSEQKQALLQSILCSVFMKDITASDIEIRNGVVVNIRQLYINENGYWIAKNIAVKKEKIKNVETTSTGNHKIGNNIVLLCSKSIANWEKKYG